MIIYKDVLSGDELYTDSFKLIKNNGLIEIECKMIEESNDIDDSLIGGNASAEEASEGVEATGVKGFDVAILNRLVEMPPFDKKSYQAHMKGYLKAIKAKMTENERSDEDIAKFQAQMTDHVKRVLKNIKDMRVFCGESMDGNGMQVLVDYREDNVTPFMIFIEEGILEEKA